MDKEKAKMFFKDQSQNIEQICEHMEKLTVAIKKFNEDGEKLNEQVTEEELSQMVDEFSESDLGKRFEKALDELQEELD